MKITILGTRGVPATYGGFETFAENLAIELVKLGHHVTVYCPHDQKYQENIYKNISLKYIFNPEGFFKNRVLRAISTLIYDFLCLVHVTFTNADVVYMLGYAIGPGLAIPRIRGKIVAVNPDGLEWKSTRWGRFAREWLHFCEKTCAFCANRLIADAPAIKQHYKQLYNVDVACIAYGANIPHISEIIPIEYAASSYYLCVARMVPETSIPLMINGFKKSCSSKILLVVGPTPDKRFFLDQVSPLIDNSRVFYLGSIYDRSLLQALRFNSAALLQGHASDGTSPSLLESMACSSPIIAIDTKSNRDILDDNMGLYFKDADQLAACIDKFDLISLDSREKLGKRNCSVIEESYSWPSVARQHIEAFKK